MHIRYRPRSRRTVLMIGFAIFMVIYSAWLARSDSLYPVKKAGKAASGSSSATASSLFTDLRARNVGDVLFVVIAESTTAQSSATTKTAQDDAGSIGAGSGLFNRLFHELALSGNISRAGNGTGTTTRSGTLVTSLAVMVKEVLPNGTLKIEGARTIGINRETQKVVFSGIVRPEDIAGDNTVTSNLVAEVQMRYDGKGIVGETQRAGILTRVLRFLF